MTHVTHCTLNLCYNEWIALYCLYTTNGVIHRLCAYYSMINYMSSCMFQPKQVTIKPPYIYASACNKLSVIMQHEGLKSLKNWYY